MYDVALYPDAELVAVNWLRAQLGARPEAYASGVQVVTDQKARTDFPRLVRVRRVGGVELHAASDSPRIVLQVRFDEDETTDKKNRQALAQLAWALMRGIRGQSVTIAGWPVAVACGRVVTFGGPANLPDPGDPSRTVTQLTVEVGMRGIAA